MATGREGREDRLNQRLRGAQRVNVGDDVSFSFDLEGVPTAQSSSSPAITAQSTRQPANASESPAQPAGSSSQRSTPNVSINNIRPPAQPSRQIGGRRTSSIARSSTGSLPDEPDELDTLQPPSSVPQSLQKRIPITITEEVTESPAKKPGSGHRRRIAPFTTDRPVPFPPRFPVSSSSTPEARSSSPSTRRPRPSDISDRPPRPSIPPRTAPLPVREQPPQPAPPRPRPIRPQRRPSPPEEISQESEPSDEEAVEVPAREAAKAIGHKRPRTSITSAELDTDETDQDTTSQISSYRTKRKSPAAQRQPAQRAKSTTSQTSKPKKKKRHSSSSDQNDDAAVEITVQRFVNNFQRDSEDDEQQEIPYANKGGETVVDVFAQVCEEVISSTLDTLEQAGASTEDVDKKKECRIKARAIEAYREELSSRLLQHAIHLNHWHSLRRRLRHVQKEKLALRDEIIRLKGEREQVALRMDAIRIKHEADSKESMYRLDASALMHDIDLAVEQGREAPELSQAAERKADLGNLDLILAQISDQVSSTSPTGGLLQQVRDFNAFLERAANALESR